MRAIFVDKEKKQINTVRFVADGYPDYTRAPHDEDKCQIYQKTKRIKKIGTIMSAGALSTLI